jgi:hypothetical protein
MRHVLLWQATEIEILQADQELQETLAALGRSRVELRACWSCGKPVYAEADGLAIFCLECRPDELE